MGRRRGPIPSIPARTAPFLRTPLFTLKMATLSYEDIVFEDEQDHLNVKFSKLFSFRIPKDELLRIDEGFRAAERQILFPAVGQEAAERKFSHLLQKHIAGMRNMLGGKPAYYIHRNSGIPLLGTNYFGLVDRGTNIIEVKPMTGCNLSCIYCSVDEGVTSARKTDYLVEAAYLVEEFRKLVDMKGIDGIEAHIGGQTDPSLYAQLKELVSGLASIPQVNVVSIDTNGLVLSEKRIKELKEAGLTRVNLSLNAISPSIAKKVSGTEYYSVSKVLGLIPFILKHLDLIVAPVWLPCVNDEEIPAIIEYILKVDPEAKTIIGIQNFLPYKHGRNPVKPMGYDLFFSKLESLERKYGVSLIRKRQDFHIITTRQLSKPFVRGEVIEADYVMPGRLNGEALYQAKGRVIRVEHGAGRKRAKLRILRDKHNIFTAQLL